APTANPAAVPSRARMAVDPVAAALVRSTDKVPSTTQKPCCTLLRSATATATARATAPRTLLRNHTERMLVCGAASPTALARAGNFRLAGELPGRPPYQRRRSAA